MIIILQIYYFYTRLFDEEGSLLNNLFIISLIYAELVFYNYIYNLVSDK